jgi:molybdopterin biosynthesis enzyme MoaB
VAGVAGNVLLFSLPGSTAACRLAAEKLLVPELGHLVALVRPAAELR